MARQQMESEDATSGMPIRDLRGQMSQERMRGLFNNNSSVKGFKKADDLLSPSQ
jgi:hypothetical protein